MDYYWEPFYFGTIKLFDIGYTSGVKLVTNFSDRLSLFTEAMSAFGPDGCWNIGIYSRKSIYAFNFQGWEGNLVSARKF